MFKKISKNIKKMSWVDIALVKLAVMAFTLFVISFLSDYFSKIAELKWLWLALWILLAIKPFVKVWLK